MTRIVFVDDEENIISGFKRSLRDFKDIWEMFFFTSQEEALQWFKKNNADILICDYRMPGKNGLELAKEIKNLDPNIKVAFLSGQSDEEVFLEIQKNSDSYISKPCDRECIRKVVEKLIK
jgi:DNA-binding NarL/FixJ family response regulator